MSFCTVSDTTYLTDNCACTSWRPSIPDLVTTAAIVTQTELLCDCKLWFLQITQHIGACQEQMDRFWVISHWILLLHKAHTTAAPANLLLDASVPDYPSPTTAALYSAAAICWLGVNVSAYCLFAYYCCPLLCCLLVTLFPRRLMWTWYHAHTIWQR